MLVRSFSTRNNLSSIGKSNRTTGQAVQTAGLLTDKNIPLYTTAPVEVSTIGFQDTYIGGSGVMVASYAGTYSVTASGTEGVLNGLNADLPAVSFAAYGGGTAKLTAPTLTSSISATFVSIGSLNATLPASTLVANGKVGGAAAAYLQHGGLYTLNANSGGQFTGSILTKYAVTSSGKVGAVGKATTTIQLSYTLNASGRTEAYGKLTASLPALMTAPSGKAWLVAPSLSLYAVGGEVVTATYEAYAINLNSGAVTHYTNYPFDNILRLENSYYGINSTGVYKIGGALDITTPIIPRVKTFLTKFGTSALKRIPYVYTSGRSDGGVTVGVSADEGPVFEYASDWGVQPEATNHRTIVGKNIRGSYYSFEVSTDGGTLELDDIHVHVAQSERTL